MSVIFSKVHTQSSYRVFLHHNQIGELRTFDNNEMTFVLTKDVGINPDDLPMLHSAIKDFIQSKERFSSKVVSDNYKPLVFFIPEPITTKKVMVLDSVKNILCDYTNLVELSLKGYPKDRRERYFYNTLVSGDIDKAVAILLSLHADKDNGIERIKSFVKSYLDNKNNVTLDDCLKDRIDKLLTLCKRIEDNKNMLDKLKSSFFSSPTQDKLVSNIINCLNDMEKEFKQVFESFYGNID